MDQYFTSVREAEQQIAAELKRPDIEAKVTIPSAPDEMVVNSALPNMRKVMPLMARLGALAMATDQTRVFNLAISEPGSQMFVPGDPLGYHQSTHMKSRSIRCWPTSRAWRATMSTAWSCLPPS